MMNLRIVSIGLAVVFALGRAQAQEGKKADHILVPYGKQRRQVLHLCQRKPRGQPRWWCTITAAVFLAETSGKNPQCMAENSMTRGLRRCGVSVAAHGDVQDIMRDCARRCSSSATTRRNTTWIRRVGAYGESAGAGASLWLATHDDLADAKAEDPVRANQAG